MSTSNILPNEVADDEKLSVGKEKYLPSPKKYACFVTGEPPTAELKKKYGDYGDMLIRFLKEDDKKEEWLRFDVRKDEFPTPTQLNEISGIAITGSPADAHSDEPWVVKLRNYCNELYTKKSHKMLGFCFGHQLLGIAVNGKSGRAKSGWEIGLRTLKFCPDMSKKYPAINQRLSPKNNDEELATNSIELNLHEFHQDQIYELPSTATVLASSKRCPVEMFEAQGVVLGIQGHPEFSTEYQDALIRSKLNSAFKDVCQTGLQEISVNKHNNEVFQSFLREWFKED